MYTRALSPSLPSLVSCVHGAQKGTVRTCTISGAPFDCAAFVSSHDSRTTKKKQQQARDRQTHSENMGQHRGARVPSSTLVISFFCFEGAGAFLAPASFSSRDAIQQRRCDKSPLGSVFRRERAAVAPRMAADGDEGNSAVSASNAEEAAAKAAKLRAFAAELRNQVRRAGRDT